MIKELVAEFHARLARISERDRKNQLRHEEWLESRGFQLASHERSWFIQKRGVLCEVTISSRRASGWAREWRCTISFAKAVYDYRVRGEARTAQHCVFRAFEASAGDARIDAVRRVVFR